MDFDARARNRLRSDGARRLSSGIPVGAVPHLTIAAAIS